MATANGTQTDSTGATAIGSEGKPSSDLPSANTLQEAGELQIRTESGKEIPFKSLYEHQNGRQLVVFIRHFFCGSCEQYIQALAATIPPSLLVKASPSTTLTIIGCGEPSLVGDYRSRTMPSLLSANEPYTIYCDPTRRLYEKLGMVCNLDEPTHASYLKRSWITNAAYSIKNGLMSGSKALKGGNFTQNGGEWLFEDGELKWCHRMKGTSDHTEPEDLKKMLGL